ncbi:MAG: hypothetical protein AABZ74_17210 [Cyanobacteriota bacterium]
MLFSPKAEAATAAGVTIGNIAVASYEDAANNKYTTNSLQVTTVVQSVYSFDIDKDGTLAAPNALVQKTVTPGGIIYYQYKITNTGNAPDNYTLDIGSGATADPNQFVPLAPNGFDPGLTGVKIFWDKDGSGKFKTGDPVLTNGVSTIPLAAGQSEYVIMEITVPSTGLTAGQTYFRNILLRSVNAPLERDNNDDGVLTPLVTGDYSKGQWSKTTIVNDAVIDVVKSSNVSNTDPSGVITYTLEVKNNGNLDAKGVTLRDVIPGDVAYVRNSHSMPSGWAISYSNTANPTNANYAGTLSATDVPAGSTVDTGVTGVRFITAASLAPGASVSVTFQVRVKPYGVTGTLPAAGTINNVGTFDYILNDGTTTVPDKTTNVVPVDINKKIAVQLSGNNTTFTNEAKLVAGDTVGGNPGNNELTTPPVFPTEGIKTTAGTVGANSNLFFRQVVTNNGNVTDNYTISTATLPSGVVQTLPSGWSVAFFQETDATTPANNTSPLVGNQTGPILAGATFNFVARVTIPANALTTTQDIFTKALSSVTGTAVGTTFTLLSNDYTLLRITDVTQPGGKIENIGAGLVVNTTNLALTESSNGTTVTFPLRVTNTGLVNDTFTLGNNGTNLLPSGWQIDYYDIVKTQQITATTSTTATLNAIGTFVVGDKVVIAGQTLTIASIATNTITFALGETLTNAPAVVNSPIIKIGSISIVSTGTLAPAGTKDVAAVITVPAGATPITKDLDFTIVSANAPVAPAVGLFKVTDSVIVPNFRSFTLTADNSGSGPAGGVLFYTHVLTNTGNVNESFNLAVASTVTPADGFTFTIQDGIIFNANGTVSLNVGAGITFSSIGVAAPTAALLTPGQYLQFKVKVNIPAGASPGTTIDTADVSATEITSTEVKKNVDTTAVVAGFLTVVKTGKTYDQKLAGFRVGGVVTGAFDPVAAATFIPGGGTGTQKVGTSGADLAAPGDIIEYTIQYSNGPSADAVRSRLKDLIPDNTTYIPDSLKMGATYAAALASAVKTDGPTHTTPTAQVLFDDEAQYVQVAAPGKSYVFFFIGTSPTFASEASPNGGTVAKSTSGVVIFRVRVN